MKKIFPRTIFDSLKKYIDRREIYAIKGPRQSGKTTILRMLEAYLLEERQINRENVVFLTMEDRNLMEAFSRDPKSFIRSYITRKPHERYYFFLDEFQYVANGGQKLKLLYDLFENIKFIITGSSSLELTGQTARFLVGRMFSFYLYQFSFDEFIAARSRHLSNAYRENAASVRAFINGGMKLLPREDIFLKDINELFSEYVIYGGYPEVIKTSDRELKEIILKNIYETYLTRDIVELLKISDVTQFRAIITLLANRIGNLINYNNLAADSHSYFKQIKQYLSMLEETFVIELIKPFHRNKTTELKKNPKVYFIDTGLRNYITRNFNPLPLRPDLGGIMENAVYTQLKINRYPSIRYWRTAAGAEVDFILETEREMVPIEVKYSTFKEPKITRGFRSFINEYRPARALVLTNDFRGEMRVKDTRIGFSPLCYI